MAPGAACGSRMLTGGQTMQISRTQFQTLARATDSGLPERVLARVQAAIPDPGERRDPQLSQSIVGWIDDARACGLRSERHIVRYVERRYATERRRAPLERRIATFLSLYHDRSLAGLDGKVVAAAACRIAARYDIRDEEAVAWLATILVHAPRGPQTDASWIAASLGDRTRSDEIRMRAVHDQAVRRGWLAQAGATA